MSDSGQPGTGAMRPSDEAVYEQCSKIAYQVAIAILGSPDDAEDIAQEACLVVFKELEAGKRIDDVRKYASTTAYHRAIKAKRRSARWTQLSDQHATVDSSGAVLGNLSIAAKAIASLTTAQRLALCLHFGQEMSGQEVGQLLGIDPRAALQLANRAKAKAQEHYADIAGTRRDMPADCGTRARQIWALVTGRLEAAEERELRDHLETCGYCRETQNEFGRDVASVLPLLPSSSSPRADDRTRLVASTRGWGGRRPRRVALAILVLLLIAGTSVPALVRRGPVVAVTPGAALASSAPIAAASPTPAPTVAPLVAGSFAYVSRGDVFYSTSATAPAIPLTQTGGRIDAIYWSPDGRSLVYKQQTGPSIVGDLHQIDLEGHEIWSLSVGAAGFAFSPDGRSYAVAIPVVSASTVSSYRVQLGRVGGQPDAGGIDIAVTNQGIPVRSASLGEASPLIWGEMPFGVGLRWTASGLHLQCDIHCGFDIDPNSGSARPNPDTYAFEPARAFSGPSGTAFTLTPPTVAINGRSVAIPGAAAVVLLSVSPDGSSALANYVRADGGHDIALVHADGSIAQLTSEGSGAFGLFQPGPSG